MPVHSFVRRYIRPWVPFPKRRTFLQYFPSFETKNITHIFGLHQINVVLDVGANKGQFGKRLRSGGYAGWMISFEPNLDAHAALLLAARRDPSWIVAEPFAIGDAPGTALLSIPTDSSLGSILPLISSQHVKHQPTKIKRLDDVIQGFHIPTGANVAIKIDVQGLEDKVLEGAGDILSRSKIVLIEVSLRPVYVGEPDYLDILQRLKKCGFDAVSFSPVTNRKLYGESWQTDVLLVRR